MSTPTVSWIAIAPVKGLALRNVEDVMLDRHGVTENRRFYLVDATGRRFGLLRHGPLVQVAADYDLAADRLTLRFPTGAVVDGEIALGERVVTDFYGRPVNGRVVEGPWAAALSEHAGQPVRLVQADAPGSAVDRSRGGVSLVSDASLEELGRLAGSGAFDGRRFRMLFGLAGCAPHEEDEWLGSEVGIGDARIRLRGTVGRCAITTQNPETGARDFDTLRAIRSYRGMSAERSIDFGVYGEVVRPGRVRVGDPVEPQVQLRIA